MFFTAAQAAQAEWSATLIDEFSSYAGAGRDGQGRSIMWIRGGRKCKPENEREHVIAGQMCPPPCLAHAGSIFAPFLPTFETKCEPAGISLLSIPASKKCERASPSSSTPQTTACLRAKARSSLPAPARCLTPGTGNEQKLQKTYQAFPLRPQAL